VLDLQKGYAQGHLRGSGGLWMRKWIKLFVHLIAMTGLDMRQRAAICSTAHRHPKSCNLMGIELLTSLRAAICNS